MWVGDVDLDELTSPQRTMVTYLLRKIKQLEEDNEELRRHLRGQSRAVVRLGKKVKEMKEIDQVGQIEQLEIPMGGQIV